MIASNIHHMALVWWVRKPRSNRHQIALTLTTSRLRRRSVPFQPTP